ncbi:MAG TPA: mandelate racemase/muconate lactonizing enzyme family protein [Candidatus Dormibacteraeota bacterium]|jgi:L-alanine-DL-glutamate epimerase-like enolase superfamily enzyme|nr:mandelate racemase/muconate lactonizing enzyme family protein [Candidatus Dormibacteraeota bacterium]
MKIERVTCRVVDFPLERDFHPAWARGRNQPNLLMVVIEVQTDSGITGIGAAHAGVEAAITIERFVAPYFIGQDPTYVERLMPVLRDTEILGAPVYCMEMPLWDIVGKIAGLPVTRLWGGYSDRVTAYCATAEVRSPERRVEDVKRILSEGYRAVKFRFHQPDPRQDLKVVEAVRAAVGDKIDIMVDANQAGVEPGHGGHRTWGFPMALTIARELERMNVRWLEEPLPRHDYDGLRRLRDKLDTLSIAGGEDNHGLHEFKLLIDRECYDILQPDALLSEGVGQMRKIAALAELSGLEMAPHTWGNGIGLMANLHLSAAIPNCQFLEFPHDPPSGWTAAARDQMLTEPLVIDPDGCVHVPDRAGFGLVLDEERIARFTVSTHTVGAGA